jgi:PAS domain S-box-containing protein
MPHTASIRDVLRRQNAELRARLDEAEETLRAIGNGSVDALVVSDTAGTRVFTLVGADAPYRILIEEMNDGAVTVSADGTILFSNRGFQRLVTWPMDEIVGARFDRFLAPGHSLDVGHLVERALVERYDAEVVLLTSEGKEMPTRISVNRLPAGFIGVVCLIVTDLTELKTKEHALRDSADALQSRIAEQAHTLDELQAARRTTLAMMHGAVADGEALSAANRDLEEQIRVRNAAEATQDRFEAQLRVRQRMEAIGTLASGIAHDFNNILGAISGYTELARLDVVGQPAALESLDEVLKASNRASALVRQMLTIGRPTVQERRTIALGPLITEVLALLRAGIPSGITFTTTIARDVSSVDADAAQVHQCIMNLGTNAAHAMRGTNGQLSVALVNCDLTEASAERPQDLEPGRYVRLSVSDTGSGMSEDTIERACDPFFTTKDVGEGTGLGLSIVRSIIRAYDGAMTVRSGLGVGTTFDLYFPAVRTANPERVEIVAAVPRGVGEHILIVDDELALGRLLKRVLERLGYTVTVETRARDAVARVRASPGTFALIVTDFHMPELLGTALAEEVHRSEPALPILVCSGNPADVLAEQMLTGGIDEVLAKPMTIDQLGRAVHRVLHRNDGVTDGERP